MCMTTTTPLPTSTETLPWRPLLLLSFGAFWTVTLEMLPAGLLPAMSADLDVRPSRVGLLVTVWAVTVGLSSVPLTRATRSWHRPTVLGVALGGLGVATLLTVAHAELRRRDGDPTGGRGRVTASSGRC